jgi:hypothetical protein
MNRERTPIHIEDEPWVDYTDPNEVREPGPLVRWLLGLETGNRVMHIKSWPGRKAKPHWHLSDTIYFVTKGELLIDGEEPYHAGDMRWVRGGFAYGSESCGPDGVEYLFFSLGPYDKIDPDEFPPPLGRWDDPSTWVEDEMPQAARRAMLDYDPLRDGPRRRS